MDINTQTSKLFNNKHRDLFIELEYVKDGLVLNGSFPISLFAGDVDLYQHVPITRLDSFVSFFVDLVYDFNRDPHISITEVKIGGKKFKSYASMRKVARSTTEIKKLLDHPKPWIKLDLVVYINGYFEDVTIIYDFSTAQVDSDDIIKSIEQDILDMTKQGKWYKLSKRMRSLMDVMNKAIPKSVKSLLDDGNLAFLYMTIARLKILPTAKGAKLRNEALNNLREDINIKITGRLGIKNPKLQFNNIPKIVKKLEKYLNSTAKAYLGS